LLITVQSQPSTNPPAIRIAIGIDRVREKRFPQEIARFSHSPLLLASKPSSPPQTRPTSIVSCDLLPRGLIESTNRHNRQTDRQTDTRNGGETTRADSSASIRGFDIIQLPAIKIDHPSIRAPPPPAGDSHPQPHPTSPIPMNPHRRRSSPTVSR
jgi:hypothetical protein